MIWYSFIPTFLTTVIGIVYLVYQFFAFKRSHWFDNSDVSFLKEVTTYVIDFFQAHGQLVTPAIALIIVVGIFYLLLPTICLGGLIQITARRRAGQEVKNIDGISYGLLSFLVLFKYHLFIKTFSFVGIATEIALILRNFESSILQFILPVFITVGIFGFLLTLLFTYSEFFIVVSKKGMLEAIGKSTKLVLFNWQHTLLMGILMLFIGVRIIINVVAVLFVPALIIASAGFFATITLKIIGLAIAFMIGFIGLIAVAYFNGIIHMFANTVWTYTFLELTEQEKNKEILE